MKIFLFTFFCINLWTAPPPAPLQPLPIPFCYFENLYFEPDTCNFYVLKNRALIEKAVNVRDIRGYRFQGIRRPIKQATPIQGTTLFLFEGAGSICCTYHFFHILEHIVGHWAYYGDRYADDVRLIVRASAGEMIRPAWSGLVWEGPNRINEHLLKALFPNAQLKTWSSFLNELQGQFFCFERVLTSDRSLSYSASSECRKLNRMLGEARFSLPQDTLEHLANRVHAYAKTEMEDPKGICRVTFLKRSSGRTLSPSLENSLLNAIQMLPDVSLRAEDFGKISFQEQINIIGNTDVLISVHGNGLSHSLFLPPASKVIEIFPPDTHTVDYRLFAEARGFDYTCIMANRGVISQEESYKIGAFGNFSATIYDFDISLILDKISKIQK